MELSFTLARAAEGLRLFPGIGDQWYMDDCKPDERPFLYSRERCIRTWPRFDRHGRPTRVRLEGPAGPVASLDLDGETPDPEDWPLSLEPGRYTLHVDSWVAGRGKHGESVCISEIEPLTLPDPALVELWSMLEP